MAKTLGFYGPGKVAKRGISRFLPSHLGDEKGRFLFLVDDAWGDSLDRILDFAVEHGDPLCIVAPGDEFIEDCKEADIPYLESDAPYDTFLDTLREEGGDLVLLWDDTNEENEENLTAMAEDAFQEGLAVYDLVHGMRELEPTDGVETEEQAEQAEAEAAAEEDEDEDIDPYEYFLDLIDAAETPDDWDIIFLDKENRDLLVRLGTELNLEFNASSWQKKIAPVVKEGLIENPVFLQNDIRAAINAAMETVPEPPFEEVTKEDVIAQAEEVAALAEDIAEAEERALKRALKSEPVTKEEAVEVIEEAIAEAEKGRPENDRPTTGISLDALEHMHQDRLDRARQDAMYDRQDLRQNLAEVAAAQGVEAAKAFYTFLQENDLA